jgi:hypothetical protein
LKIVANGKDITNLIDPLKMLSRENIGLPKTPFGVEKNPLIAASAVKVIRGLLQDTREIAHAPGPNGLPGGYPVRLSRKDVDVVLPDELTLEEAIRINNESGKLDGIDEVKGDGTIVLTEKSMEIVKEELDYEYKPFNAHESEKLAKELGVAFMSYAKKHGLPDFALKAIWTGQTEKNL